MPATAPWLKFVSKLDEDEEDDVAEDENCENGYYCEPRKIATLDSVSN